MRFSVAAAFAVAGTAFAADHLVVVGNNSKLLFEPDNIKAAEGDTVTFKFWPKNHSVAQATFNNPCQPMENGFWSGYIPSSDKAAATEFMFTVKNASQPVWFYCTQGKHCQGGMVGVINGPSQGNTIERFKQAAANASNNTTPSSVAGFGGMLMENGSMSSGNGSGAGGSSPNAATSVGANSGLIFAGVLGSLAYALL
jgi:plastocyanin